MKSSRGENKMANKKVVAQEIVNLMSRGGAYPGLWTGEPMNADEVTSYVEKNGFLPMQNGHTANGLEMQNTRHKISRRVNSLKSE
jgi:hypothetical protein